MMTRHRTFKQLVRTRMEKTGESYTAARAMLLATHDGPHQADPAAAAPASPRPVLATSDEAIRQRTGRGWEEWFDQLDAWGAVDRPHREIARWLAEQLEADPLAWSVQAVAVSYDRARKGRAVGERTDGFAATATRTIGVDAETVFDAFMDESARAEWLPDGQLRTRTSTRPRSARFDWESDETRVLVTFEVKGAAKTTVAVEHSRLADADEADKAKLRWREALTALRTQLEGGGDDA
jgi:uncharacterized protein YndB with AHSA1/START domain